MPTHGQSPAMVARVAALLRALGASEPTGTSTTELGKVTGLARPTAHRLLTSLAAEGLVDRDARTGRWSLGRSCTSWGGGGRKSVRHHRPGSRRRRRTCPGYGGESAFLSARRGDETVCILSQEGSFPLRSHVLHEGKRFPLGGRVGGGLPS